MNDEVCYNCLHYDGRYCTKDWNNLDPDYCIPERDSKDRFDCCDEWEADE